MKILVTGANGQLGCSLRRCAGQGGAQAAGSTGMEWIFTDVNELPGLQTTYLDITDLDSVRAFVRQNGVQAIVNCAAWTNVDAAEIPENYQKVLSLNAKAPENLAVAMKEVGGYLVHISTDYVFGKEPYNTPCKEDQQGTPTGVYGQTKLLGEQNIRTVFEGTAADTALDAAGTALDGAGTASDAGVSAGGYVIIRTAWLYSEYGKNFCKTMLNLMSTKPQISVVFDQVGTPTYAGDLAGAIVKVLEQFAVDCSEKRIASGIYHYSNEGVCSWYDFAVMIQKLAVEAGRQAGSAACKVVPCHSWEFESAVIRPSYSVLDKSKIKAAFGLEIPYWVDSLRKCIEGIDK